MELHHTPEFRDWYSKAVRSQPSGNKVTKEYAMICWIVSFSGRIIGVDKSYQGWITSYTKFRSDVTIEEIDEKMFDVMYEKYNMKNAEALGLGKERDEALSQFTTDQSDNSTYDRAFNTSWLETPACESR